MPLWGDLDQANNAPKYQSTSNAVSWNMQQDYTYFVDETEAQVASNKAKGLNKPGWNVYRTYTDSDGNTRHRAENLVFMKRTSAEAGDLGVTGNTTNEDSVVADS